MKKKVRKYLLYGVGEILLIIIGILIALQIDNWNTERQEEALLQSYLQSIATNMRDDAVELEELREVRSTRVFETNWSHLFTGQPGYVYSVPEIFFFTKVVAHASENLYFKSESE